MSKVIRKGERPAGIWRRGKKNAQRFDRVSFTAHSTLDEEE
ncbi:TPA: hypothetical protein ACJIXE_000520 [Serratia marcescens]